MAEQLTIIWSMEAKVHWRQILQYYVDRNKSSKYSKKLAKEMQQVLQLLATFPEMGKLHPDFPRYRYYTKNKHLIFYRIEGQTLIVAIIWDTRQNKKTLKGVLD